MEPSLQLVLDALNSRFNDFERRLDDRNRAFANRTAFVDSRFIALEASQAAHAMALEERLSTLVPPNFDPVATSMLE